MTARRMRGIAILASLLLALLVLVIFSVGWQIVVIALGVIIGGGLLAGLALIGIIWTIDG